MRTYLYIIRLTLRTANRFLAGDDRPIYGRTDTLPYLSRFAVDVINKFCMFVIYRVHLLNVNYNFFEKYYQFGKYIFLENLKSLRNHLKKLKFFTIFNFLNERVHFLFQHIP